MSGIPGFSQKFSRFYSSIWLNSIRLSLNLSVSEELCEGAEDNQVGICMEATARGGNGQVTVISGVQEALENHGARG